MAKKVVAEVSPLAGRNVIIIDDVITSGGSIREAIDLVNKERGHVVAVCVALDRQEKWYRITQAKMLANEQCLKVFSIATFSELIKFARVRGLPKLSVLEAYQREHCITE